MLRNICYAISLTLLLLLVPIVANGDDTASSLLLDELSPQPVTSRSPRPISKIAENVTVVTSNEIARLNAHSLAEVLQTVAGVFVENTRTPGSFTFFSLSGLDDGYNTILLFIDGIRQGNLNQGTIDPGMIPVQNIDRVEIIKGAASAAWGPALGGVVNVVTKSPETGRALSGTASASYGERKTSDLTAELSGTSGNLGYYLAGGNLHSAGLLPNNGTNRNSLYGKFTYDLPSLGTLTFGISSLETKRGLEEIYVFDADPPYTEHDNAITRRYHSFVTFVAPLRTDLSLELTAHDSTFNDQAFYGTVNTSNMIDLSNHFTLDERNSGVKAKLFWGDSSRNLATGIEYLHSSIKVQDRLHPEWGFFPERRRDNLSLYANGTFSIDKLTILPGIRYDKTGLSENTLNLTLGATYRLGEATILRSYWATGYAIPVANTANVPAQVRTFQVGIESEAVPYLWLKGTYFHNHIWQIQDFQDNAVIFHTRNIQGFEVEAKTSSIMGVSFRGGYTFTDARDSETNDRIKGVPINLIKLALAYNNSSTGTDALLSGNYAWLNMDYVPHYAHYNPFIWNLHFTQKLLPANDLSPELFFNINNVFNGSQYWDYWYKNTPRWIEGGVRFKF